MNNTQNPPPPEIMSLLQPQEHVLAHVRSTEGRLAVTDRRILVIDGGRLALNVGVERVRRIEFDVDKGRPATMVIVPEDAEHGPQVLSIPESGLQGASSVLAVFAERLSQTD